MCVYALFIFCLIKIGKRVFKLIRVLTKLYIYIYIYTHTYLYISKYIYKLLN